MTGQDGAYLAEYLLSLGYVVHGIKRRSSWFNTAGVDHLYQHPHVGNVPFLMHYGDMTDSTNPIRLVQQIRPTEIYNLAAQSHVAVSFESPQYTMAKAYHSQYRSADPPLPRGGGFRCEERHRVGHGIAAARVPLCRRHGGCLRTLDEVHSSAELVNIGTSEDITIRRVRARGCRSSAKAAKSVSTARGPTARRASCSTSAASPSSAGARRHCAARPLPCSASPSSLTPTTCATRRRSRWSRA
ncbi:hypothetical protein ACVWWG_008949 [Bradyrhizobium sp. LB7.2]